MGLGRRHQPPPINELNLVPMMDVLMAVLTFFIVISMTLSTGQNILGVNLPKTDDGTTQNNPNSKMPDPLIVGINPKGQVIIDNKPVSSEQLQAQLTGYFKKSSTGVVVLQADRTLAYEKITKVLGQIRAIGGDRVALAVDK
ncbi:MAG: biopolymer transporter ExbD [Thermosynechococcaceae cyanobacterium]